MKYQKRLFAYCVAEIKNDETADLANWLVQETSKHGDLLYIFTQPYVEEGYDVMRLINFEETDGIIIDVKSFSPGHIAIDYIAKEAKAHNIPVIAVDGKLAGCISVSYDYGSAFEELIEHVITVHGCKKIDMIAGTPDNSFSEERIDVFRSVLERHGIPFRKERVFYGYFWHDPTIAAMEKLLADPAEFPQAIVCVNDATAIAACEVLNERGYSVPKDIIVTGFDGIEEARLHYPKLTTAQQEKKVAAEAIMNALYGKLNGEAVGDISIPFSLCFSQSCGCEVPTDYDRNTALRILSAKIGNSRGYDEHMIHFGDRLAASNSINEVDEIIGRYSFMKSIVAINTGFYDFSTDIPYDAENPFEQELTIVCHKGSDSEFFNDRTVKLRELIPENSENPETANVSYMFTAVRFGKVTLGYVAMPSFGQWNEMYAYVEKFMATLSQGLVQIHMREHMKYLYNRDSMTGLNNRRGFFEAIKEILRCKADGKHYLNIYSLDMNDLKYINDTFGHSDGDFAIKTMSKALAAVAKGRDCYTARFGGDEFVAALITENEPDGGAFAKEFTKELKRLAELASKPYRIVSSCGSCSAVITADLDIDGIIRSSDVMMYEDKACYKRDKQRTE